ncbi:hypothetical protein B0H34DRAFT_384955 [Crassisporium funariophilum]|nr:hypothetical protein B0H34DRAFT_384955 [Crassisporium funariophilum]
MASGSPMSTTSMAAINGSLTVGTSGSPTMGSGSLTAATSTSPTMGSGSLMVGTSGSPMSTTASGSLMAGTSGSPTMVSGSPTMASGSQTQARTRTSGSRMATNTISGSRMVTSTTSGSRTVMSTTTTTTTTGSPSHHAPTRRRPKFFGDNVRTPLHMVRAALSHSIDRWWILLPWNDQVSEGGVLPLLLGLVFAMQPQGPVIAHSGLQSLIDWDLEGYWEAGIDDILFIEN